MERYLHTKKVIILHQFDSTSGLFHANKNTLGSNISGDYNPWAPISSIEAKFRDTQFMESIKNILPDVKARKLKQVPAINGLFLERMGGIPMSMTEMSYEESIGELQKLIGFSSVKKRLEDTFNVMQ
jgi:hypothetical protein